MTFRRDTGQTTTHHRSPKARYREPSRLSMSLDELIEIDKRNGDWVDVEELYYAKLDESPYPDSD